MINNIDINSTYQSRIFDIVRRSLGFIDRRLIDHGERVAFIAGCIAAQGGGLGLDHDKLLILSLLHDIGAYKTEEIDDMVKFETHDALNHAKYGYVFLYHTTSLGDDAEAILYHHTNYEKLQQRESAQPTLAALIFLADRIDILMGAEGPPDWSSLQRAAGTVFSPALVELFLAAEAEQSICARVRDGSFTGCIEAEIDQLQLSQEETLNYLKMLVYSIDFRSPFTVTHTANSTAISRVLAQLCGLDHQQQQDITLGAFLHDIGKIAIPYAILEHPGRLSAEEMAIMRTHVAVSEEILSGIVPDHICQIAVRHHEKLNGSGYHQGLRAEELTLPQRIVAVADILSALIGQRSYKQPYSKEKTLDIVAQMCAAGELCPRVCALTRENYDHIMEVTDQADDPVIELYQAIQQHYHQLLADSD